MAMIMEASQKIGQAEQTGQQARPCPGIGSL
jgi:hypothetical protein